MAQSYGWNLQRLQHSGNNNYPAWDVSHSTWQPVCVQSPNLWLAATFYGIFVTARRNKVTFMLPAVRSRHRVCELSIIVCMHTCVQWSKWKIWLEGTQFSEWPLNFSVGPQPCGQGPSDADASEYLMPYLPSFFSQSVLVLSATGNCHRLFCTDVVIWSYITVLVLF